MENKTVVQYARPLSGERCHVYLLQLYLSKLPESAFQRDIFYMRPRPSIPYSATTSWYYNSPLGHNTLDSFLKEMFSVAGLDTANKSNHSLRATAISRLYQGHVPEKLIMEHSGHLSRDGISSYERTTPAQEKFLSDILAKPGSSTSKQPVIDDSQKMDLSHGESSGVKQENDSSAAEELKKLQFSQLTGCTINFNFKA